MASRLARARGDHQAVAHWRGQPAVAVAMAVLLTTLFWHIELGLRVIVKGYVHGDRAKLAPAFMVDLVCAALMAIGVFTGRHLVH